MSKSGQKPMHFEKNVHIKIFNSARTIFEINRPNSDLCIESS